MSKILFFSSTQFGAEILETLHESKNEIVGVITRSDKVRGRGNKIISTPVKKYAEENNIEVFEKDFLSQNDESWIKDLNADFFVVVAYGAILPQYILGLPKLAPINIHASLLPKYRGASPIESVIKDGKDKTGITYMKMVKALDAGDIYKVFELSIGENETFDSLNQRLCNLSKETIVNVLSGIESGELKAQPQGPGETYVGKISKEGALVDFNFKSKDIKNKINALSSHIGAYAYNGDDRYKLFSARLSELKLDPGFIKVSDGNLHIGTSDGSVIIDEIQAPGKKKMKTSDFLRGNNIEGRFENKR